MNAPVGPSDRVSPKDRAAALLRARYRHEPDVAPPVLNDTLEGLLSHRSVRAFQDRPLPDGTLPMLIAAAQSAASSSNLQPWSVVAIEDPARKAGLAALAGNQAFIREAPLFLVWLIDFNRLTDVAAAQDRQVEGLDYTESFTLGVVDTSLAAQNATVALESMGLGSVYVGAIRNHPAEVAEALGLPPKVFALFGMAVGWPDADRPAAVKPRLPQAAVLFHERHAWSDRERAAVESYNPRIRAFQDEQGMTAQDWTRQAVTRTQNAGALAGRHVLREVLQGLGFRLR